MKQIKNDISVYIQNVTAHKFMKDKLLGLVNDCKSNSLDNVSNTDWHESNIERKYWDCFYSMIEPYLENLCLRLNKEKFTVNDTIRISINVKNLSNIDGKEVVGGFSLSVGNPHLIFFVEELNKFDLNKIGPQLENHNYFPEKCNITLASIINKKYIKVKVWERGAGLTRACGTAACATAVSGSILGLNDRSVDIEFIEGLLNINWKKDNNIYMTGKVSKIKKIVISI